MTKGFKKGGRCPREKLCIRPKLTLRRLSWRHDWEKNALSGKKFQGSKGRKKIGEEEGSADRKGGGRDVGKKNLDVLDLTHHKLPVWEGAYGKSREKNLEDGLCKEIPLKNRKGILFGDPGTKKPKRGERKILGGIKK